MLQGKTLVVIEIVLTDKSFDGNQFLLSTLIHETVIMSSYVSGR